VRQSFVAKTNPGALDQNQQLLVWFPNDGAHYIIVRLEFTSTQNDDSDVFHCYQDIETTAKRNVTLIRVTKARLLFQTSATHSTPQPCPVDWTFMDPDAAPGCV